MPERRLAALGALLLGACQPVVTAAPPPTERERFVALGTEPFWSVKVQPGRLTYSTPETIAGISFPARRDDAQEGMRWTGSLDGRAFVLVIAEGPCSDGMSDTAYAYTARLTIGEATERGCARTAE